jgi:hypothetical protein
MKVFDLFQGDEIAIGCPVCRLMNSHICRVYSRAWRDADEGLSAYEGTHLTIVESPQERRIALVIEFDGECEHRWRLVIQQHKGTDFLTVESLPNHPERTKP